MYYGQCLYVMNIVHEIFSKNKIFWKKFPNTMKNFHVIWPMSIKYMDIRCPWTIVHEYSKTKRPKNTVKQKFCEKH